jgi:hypothetical protein
MIYCLGNANIRLSPQEVGQFRIHHRCQVFPDNLSDIQTDHLKQLARSLLNLLENRYKLLIIFILRCARAGHGG